MVKILHSFIFEVTSYHESYEGSRNMLPADQCTLDSFEANILGEKPLDILIEDDRPRDSIEDRPAPEPFLEVEYHKPGPSLLKIILISLAVALGVTGIVWLCIACGRSDPETAKVQDSSDGDSREQRKEELLKQAIYPVADGATAITCPTCQGSGRSDDSEHLACKICGAKGKISTPVKSSCCHELLWKCLGDTTLVKTCEACELKKHDDCPICQGEGYF